LRIENGLIARPQQNSRWR